MQLVAYGAQDIYLTGNPQITFFKVVYRRHTNFSMEAIQQTWDGTSITDGKCSATISRNGDLVYRMYLQVTGTAHLNKIDNPGASFITDVELEIGGQRIDKHSGLWMETWAELTEPNPSHNVGKTDGGNFPRTLFQKMSYMGGINGDNSFDFGEIYVPLQFWFCRNPGLALPLIALQYHEVKVNLNHTISNTFTLTKHELFCDYIYLDTDERRRFAQVSHEYLIEQVQEQSITTGEGSKKLNFNHPVKELIWTKRSTKVGDTEKDSIGSGSTTFQLKLNGHDRFEARDYRYFSRTQVWQHHTGCGGLDCKTPAHGNDSIGVYSFALKPEEHQPSGTCNFSRIDSAHFVATGPNNADTMFAVNYNVLRIMSGMGGLAYSN